MADTVFLSSTWQDLAPCREAVSRFLRKAGHVPSEMESFGARDQEPLEACLQEVVDADLFVGIYAWRYGFVPPGSAVSITELELLEAERRHKPIFCFVIDEGHQGWPPELREDGDGARRLEALKRRVREKWVVETFTTPEGLAASVLAALTRWQERQSAAELSPGRHVQLALLEKVERFWIDGVLRKAVPEGRRLRISREERPDAVGRPALEEVSPELAPGEVVEPIHDLFLRQGRSLLLLGPPGSGKTIALLDLARGLARVARRDPSAAVPVIFNLASWKGQERDLAAWMARELARRYQAGPKAAAEWISRDQILPLLDGLDEVEPDRRAGCVDAINAHLQEHGLATGMAVVCHTQVCEELPDRLQLETAVVLQLLTSGQIDEHLQAAGSELAGLRAALAGDPGLRELAASPLMLTLLERTFRNAAPEDLPSGCTAGIERVFEAYVTHVLEPGRELPWTRELPPEGGYAPGRTRRSLAWLARGMAEHDPALFQVERLQPAWLTSRLQVAAYAVLSRALGGALLAFPLALVFLPDLFRGMTQPQLIRAGVLLVLIFGVVFGVRGTGRGFHRDIRVAEALVWRGWSWRGAAIGAGALLVFSLAFWALHPGSDRSVSYLGDAGFWVPFSLTATVLGGLLFGVFGGLGGRALEKKAWPNQGTWLALRNAGVAGLITGLTTMLGLGLVLGALSAAIRILDGRSLPRSILPWIPLEVGAVLAVWAGLAYSGLDFVQHFSLRLILRLTKRVPGRLVGLLDHAVERGLLQRPGGSYRFFHPLLLEFFAKKDDGAGDGIRTRDQQLGRL